MMNKWVFAQQKWEIVFSFHFVALFPAFSVACCVIGFVFWVMFSKMDPRKLWGWNQSNRTKRMMTLSLSLWSSLSLAVRDAGRIASVFADRTKSTDFLTICRSRSRGVDNRGEMVSHPTFQGILGHVGRDEL